jgi:DNA-binding beta-propeller fold protein YncE
MLSVKQCLALILAAFAASSALADGSVGYKITRTVMLGPPDGWDYLYYEPTQDRVYIAHSTEVTVVDGRSGDIVGRVQGIAGVNGVTAIPALGKGYTDSRGRKAVVAFDLKTFQVIKEISADADTDGLIYEPTTKRVFVVHGDPGTTTVIDAISDKAVGTVQLGGKPEYLVADDAGHVYVILTDKKEIVRINANNTLVDARWPVDDCERGHGLAIDKVNHRLFASCANAKMVVVDSDKGAVLATIPIGKGTDAAGFDAKRKLAFSSNGEGNLSVISEQRPDKFVSLGEVPTKPFARTMTLDPDTGRVFLVTADFDDVNPQAENPRQRYQIKRGTVQLLFLDP